MLIDDLTEPEIGLLVVALKYWRAHRCGTATRHTDPLLTNDAVSRLLAKLDPSALPSTRRRPAGMVTSLRQHKGH